MADKSFIEDSLEKAKGKISSIISKKEAPKEKEKKEAGELPETAKDMFGDVSDIAPVGPIEEAPESEESPPKKKLAPDELPALDLPKQEPKPKPDRKIVEAADVEDIQMFEDAVGFYQEPETPEDIDPFVETPKEVDSGFFNEFEKFMEGNDVPKLAEEVIGKDLLEKMKDFHSHREDGKPYYFHSDDLKKAMKSKLLELKNLEHDWIRHKEQISREESMLIQKESDMENKLEELKFVMQQMKVKDDFHKEAPDKRYFILADGHALKSLSDLRTALRVMDEELLKKHFNEKENHFADWAKTVFGKDDLYAVLLAANSREELINGLESFEKPSNDEKQV